MVDEIERFVEYNSTTTQSDYGERFDSFLDFLRAEAAYRRDEWDLTPLRIAHEVLAATAVTAVGEAAATGSTVPFLVMGVGTVAVIALFSDKNGDSNDGVVVSP